MTYRVRNITIAVALAVIAALLTSFYVTNYQRDVRKDETNVPVFVAKKDIPSGTSGADIVRKGLLSKTEIVRRSVVPGAISNPTQIEALVATQPIFAGEQVTTRRFATPAQRGIRSQLTGTMRAFQLPGDQHQLLAGILKQGDRVDVVASMKPNPNVDVYYTRTILRDIEVLKAPVVASTTGERLSARTQNAFVVLAIADNQIPKLFHAQRHGEFSLELRPPVKSSDSPEAVQSAVSILTDGLRGSQLQQLAQGGENE
jgi:Flp pilus assembly protein CpaB